MMSYRLAPFGKYPKALDDVWQSYLWILKYLKSSLGLDPEKIFISGDSAGSNLAVSLTSLCICKGVRKPDALFCQYPALIMQEDGFVPSRVFSFDDCVLNHSLMKLC